MTASRWVLAYLLNSAWQVPMLFGVGWLVTRVLRRLGPGFEHRVWVAVLLGQVLLPVASMRTERFLKLLRLRGDVADPSQGTVSVTLGPVRAHGWTMVPEWLAIVVVAAYLLATSYFAVRLVMQAVAARRLRRDARCVEAAGLLRETWNACAKAFGVRRASLATAEGVFGPLTLGVRDAVIVLPSSMLKGIDAVDMRAVLAHEFAHIARRDFLKNLLYEMLALPVKYNPAYWAARSRMVESREMVCDALAAEVTAGARRYARSLVHVISTLTPMAPARNVHAIGLFDAHSLERRIMRLTEEAVVTTKVQRAAMVTACVALGFATCASAMRFGSDVWLPEAGAAQAAVVAGEQGTGAPKISPGVMAGQLLQKSVPPYPPEAKAAGIQGTVVLRAVIGKNGSVKSLQAVSGPKELLQSAMEAVALWVYRPYLLNGQPTEVETTVTVNYHSSVGDYNSAKQGQ